MRETETGQRDNPFTHAHTQARHTKYAWNPAAGAPRPGGRENLPDRPAAGCCVPGRVHGGVLRAGPADGTLTGHLYGVGGPAAGLPRLWPGTVTVTGPGVHRDIPAGASGSYSVTVPAGHYTVAGHSPRYASGTGLCQAAGVAMVTSGHSTKADVLCQMR